MHYQIWLIFFKISDIGCLGAIGSQTFYHLYENLCPLIADTQTYLSVLNILGNFGMFWTFLGLLGHFGTFV